MYTRDPPPPFDPREIYQATPQNNVGVVTLFHYTLCTSHPLRPHFWGQIGSFHFTVLFLTAITFIYCFMLTFSPADLRQGVGPIKRFCLCSKVSSEGKNVHCPISCLRSPGGTSHMKGVGMLVGNFELNP